MTGVFGAAQENRPSDLDVNEPSAVVADAVCSRES